jgi:hypothetical protein
MRSLLPIRAAALVVVAVFGFHLSRFYLAADLTNFVCPHHVQPTAAASPAEQANHSAMQHGSHAMQPNEEPDPGTRPGGEGPGMRCCCRHSLDGLITALVLFGPAGLADVPAPASSQRVSLAADLPVPQNDLTPPFIPPRA